MEHYNPNTPNRREQWAVARHPRPACDHGCLNMNNRSHHATEDYDTPEQSGKTYLSPPPAPNPAPPPNRESQLKAQALAKQRHSVSPRLFLQMYLPGDGHKTSNEISSEAPPQHASPPVGNESPPTSSSSAHASPRPTSGFGTPRIQLRPKGPLVGVLRSSSRRSSLSRSPATDGGSSNGSPMPLLSFKDNSDAASPFLERPSSTKLDFSAFVINPDSGCSSVIANHKAFEKTSDTLTSPIVRPVARRKDDNTTPSSPCAVKANQFTPDTSLRSLHFLPIEGSAFQPSLPEICDGDSTFQPRKRRLRESRDGERVPSE